MNRTEPSASPEFTELSQKISKLHEEAIQRREAWIAAEQSTSETNSWQEETDRHRALIQQKLGKLAEQRKAEIEKLDRLDRSFKTIRLLAWLSFILSFCALATVIFTSIYQWRQS